MGTELLATGSVVAAFLAGGVALFAPCCIVFLAPSYLAGAVKNRRWRLLPLTFIFAAGLAVVLLPLTLGASLLAGAIAQYHQVLYYGGGALMIGLGVLALTGKMWSLPSFVRAPDTTRGDTASFFSLGVFSGIASACCAPVLVGVMTLSALSATPGGGLILGTAYVFGMVFPLFVMALIWDAARLGERSFMKPAPVRLSVRGREFTTSRLNIAVAVGFVVMGIAVIALANQPTMTGGTEAQAAISRWLTSTFLEIQEWVAPVPEVIQALLLFALAGLFVWVAARGRRRSRSADVTHSPTASGTASATATDSGCHDNEARPAVGEAASSTCHQPQTTRNDR